ncbi:beta-lactamase/transpeptidase-like protein [Powellomyces hirtus]|nr:beta-lactamase/transpeptidase-like protein [Powellomyces hirtus]
MPSLAKATLFAGFIAMIVASPIQQTAAAAAPAADPYGNFTSDVEKWRSACKVDKHGLAVAVSYKGKQYARGFGSKTLDHVSDKRNKVQEDTAFLIASLTKTFTSLGVAQAVTDNTLNWTDVLRDTVPAFWPEYPGLVDPDADANATIVDLLSHQTGVPQEDTQLLLFKQSELFERTKHLRPAGPFRKGFYYSNQMYTVAGHIAAKAQGVRSWEAYTRQAILKPLGLKQTVPTIAEYNRLQNRARGNVANATQEDVDYINSLLDSTAPAGSIGISARDMAKYLQTLLALYHGKPTKLKISAEDGKAIFVNRFLRSPNNTDDGYALGLYRSRWNRNNQTSLRHAGSIFGFTSIECLSPDQDLGVAVLTNSELGEGGQCVVMALCDTIRERILFPNEEPTKPLPVVTPPPRTVVPQLPTRDPRAYIGTYTSPAFGDLEIKQVSNKANGTLSLTLTANRKLIRLVESARLDPATALHVIREAFPVGQRDAFVSTAAAADAPYDILFRSRDQNSKVDGVWVVLDARMNSFSNDCQQGKTKIGCAEFFSRVK